MVSLFSFLGPFFFNVTVLSLLLSSSFLRFHSILCYLLRFRASALLSALASASSPFPSLPSVLSLSLSPSPKAFSMPPNIHNLTLDNHFLFSYVSISIRNPPHSLQLLQANTPPTLICICFKSVILFVLLLVLLDKHLKSILLLLT